MANHAPVTMLGRVDFLHWIRDCVMRILVHHQSQVIILPRLWVSQLMLHLSAFISYCVGNACLFLFCDLWHMSLSFKTSFARSLCSQPEAPRRWVHVPATPCGSNQTHIHQSLKVKNTSEDFLRKGVFLHGEASRERASTAMLLSWVLKYFVLTFTRVILEPCFVV